MNASGQARHDGGMRNLAMLVLIGSMLASCDPEKAYRKASDDLLADSYRKVCDDAVKQYEIAKRNGSPIDACVQAGFAAAAFLQAKEESSYAEWKRTESADCAKAGITK